MKSSSGITAVLIAVLLLNGCSDDVTSDQKAEPAAAISTSTTTTVSTTTTTSPPTTAPPLDEAPTATVPPAPAPVPEPAAPPVPSPAVTPTTSVDRYGPEFALNFYRSTETRCAEHADKYGNDRVPPDYFAGAFVAGPKGDGAWHIVDGKGNGLIIEATEGVIYGIDGWDGELPLVYSFGCPEDLYLGGVSE